MSLRRGAKNALTAAQELASCTTTPALRTLGAAHGLMQIYGALGLGVRGGYCCYWPPLDRLPLRRCCCCCPPYC